jgi:hypothetical protein
MNNSGSGDSSGATFNGSIAKTISYNTIGAPSTSGTGATGTWGISITGSSGSTAFATSAGSVTNGVYTTGDQTIGGNKTFTGTTTVSGATSLTGNTFASSLYAGGTTTSTTMTFQPNSINFYDADTGNGFNSIAYGATSTALADQVYQFAYKTPSVAGATAAYNFFGDGTAQKTGGGSWGSVSDSRLKDNVTPLTGALAKITSLNPVSYSWKIETTDPTVGFIAQEVQQVIPNAVRAFKSTDKEKPFTDGNTVGIAWQNDMTAYLVASIKELKVQLDAANARITALENA